MKSKEKETNLLTNINTNQFHKKREREKSKKNLESFFSPDSIAVVGASPNRSKLGNIILRNIISAPDVNSIYPVNPKYQKIEGFGCYKRILDIPGKIDLVIISLSSEHVPKIVQDCIRKNVSSIVVISSGFSEIGREEGYILEKSMAKLISDSKLRMVGPNTLGYYIPHRGLDVMFLQKGTFRRPGSGGIALISQSGSLGVDFMEELFHVGSGISIFMGLGNKIDINENDVMEYLSTDEKTNCIGLYLEAISEGNRFYKITKSLSKTKPVVLLKGGRSAFGEKAATLHTGRMGGEYRVLQGIMEQNHIIETRDEEEFIDILRVMNDLPKPRGNQTLIITNGGGNGIISVDILQEKWSGTLALSELSKEFKETIKHLLPEFISPGNPIDLSAQASNFEYLKSVEMACECKVCDLIIVGITPNEKLDDSLVSGLHELKKKFSIPIITYLKGNSLRERVIKKMGYAKLPAFPSVKRAISAAGNFIQWHRNVKKFQEPDQNTSKEEMHDIE